VEGPGRDENVGIGVRLRTVQGHFVVTAVDRDSAADAGGVEVEDVLLAIDGCSIVRVPPHAVRKLITGPVGTRVHLSLRRGTRTFTAALIRTPPNPESSTAPATDYGASRLMRRSPGRDDGRPAGLGMVLAWDKQHQVRVNLLNPDGPARRSGLVCKGDILWAVGEQRLIFRDVNDRAANMVKVKHLLSGANASQVVLTLQPADGGEKRRAVLFREIFSALQRFDDRLAMLQQSANEEVAAREAEQLRQTLKTCSGEVTPNLLLIGQPGHGKSSLLNTVFRAINKSTGSLACVSSMDENVTQDLEKYDDVVEESVHQPFVVYDTKGIGGDKRSAALLSSVITGRHGVGQRMDGGWWSRNRNVLKLHRDFVHGVVLVHDATQEVNPDVVDVVRTVCDAEGQVPVAVALTKIDVAQSQRLDVAARAAKLSELMPSAVFFPVVSYTKPTELGDGRIDLAVLSLFEQARTQGLRHLRFRHAERKWREIENA